MGWNLSLQNSYVEFLTPSVMVFGGELGLDEVMGWGSGWDLCPYKKRKPLHGSQPCCGEGACITQWNSCHENTMNSIKRQKERTSKDEPSRLEGVQYATGEEWRELLIAPERMKWKRHSVVGVSGGESKIPCCKNNIAEEPGTLGPWIKVNWMWSSRRLQEETSTS